MPRATPPLLALALALTACGAPPPERPAATADSTLAARGPDTAWVRVPDDRAAAYPDARPVSLAPRVLLPCPGAVGDSVTGLISTPGGTLRLPLAGHSLTVVDGALARSTPFTLRERAGTGHLQLEVGPDASLGLPATLRVNLRRCGAPADSVTLVRLRPGAPAEDVGGQRADSLLSAPVSRLGEFAVARR